METHGPPTPPDAVEEAADQATGLIIVSAPSYAGEIELGTAYVFTFVGRELTGIAVRLKKNWVTLRTKTTTFTVPVADVLRPAQ